jgi:hypothetical protein
MTTHFNKILSSGCSFIQGSELGDEYPFSKHTYPALISQHYNVEYDCVAYPSASNQGIAKSLFDYGNLSGCFVIVQWTFPSRLGLQLSYPFKNKHGQDQRWFDLAPNNWDLINHFNEYREYTEQLKNLQIDKLHDIVYRHAGNDDNFMFYTLLAIRAVQQLLVSTNTPYLFVAGCNALRDINQVHTIEGLGFVEYCDNKNFTKGKHNHPLHDAHKSVCNLILEKKLV